MDQQRYSAFLNNPCDILNEGNVRHLRLDSSMGRTRANSVARTVSAPGAVPLHYQYEKASVSPVFVRYDDTPIPQTSAIWVSQRKPSSGDYQKDRAYYLQWGPDSAYAVELGFEAQLFFTAELTGCGIIVLSGAGKTVLVHHNIQVTPPGPTFFQNLFESNAKKMVREAAAVGRARTDSLYLMLQNIVASTPGLTSGKMLGVQQYGGTARFFGMKRGGSWRFYVNRPGSDGYTTQEIFG